MFAVSEGKGKLEKIIKSSILLLFPQGRANWRRLSNLRFYYCSRREGQTGEDIRQDIFELHCPRHAPRHDKSHEVTKTHQNPLTVLSMTHY